MSIVSPIHIEAIGLANLRFFAPPSGGQEFPWLSIDDLHACMGLPRDLRREFKARLRKAAWRHDVHLVALGDDIANIIPHYMAQGLIDAMRDVGHLSPDFYSTYAAAGAQALSKLTQGLDGQEILNYIAAAWKSSGGNAEART